MSDKRRATRYGAFFESADKVGTSAAPVASKTSGRKSPARVEINEKTTTTVTTIKSGRKSPARVDLKSERKESPSPVKKTTKRASKSPARRDQSKSRKASKSPARVTKKESTKAKEVKKEAKEVKIETKEDTKKRTGSKKSQPSVVIESLAIKDVKKDKTAATKEKKKSPARNQKATKSDLDSDPDFSPLPKRRTRQASAAEKTEKDKSAGTVSMSRSVVEEFSDHETQEWSFKKRVKSKLDELKEFGGTIGCLLLFVLYPLVTYGLNYFCTAKSCIFKTHDLAEFKRLSTYYNLELAKLILPFIAGITTLNIFPLGRVVKVHTDRGYAEYQYNGLTLSVVTVGGIVAAEYFKYPVVDVVYRHYQQLLLFFLLNAIFQAFLLFLPLSLCQSITLEPLRKDWQLHSGFLCWS